MKSKTTQFWTASLFSATLILPLCHSEVYAADQGQQPAASDNNEKIYKKIGPGGEVIYSDKPTSGSEEIKVPGGSSYKPVTPPPGFTPYQPPPKITAHKEIDNMVTITSPQNDAALWSGEGELSVSINLANNLTAGQQLEYLIDGESVYRGTDTTHTFTNIYRGTHVLTVRITDSTGEEVITSTPVTFHMQRPIKKNWALPIVKHHYGAYIWPILILCTDFKR